MRAAALKTFGALVVVLGLSFQAQAATITLSSTTGACGTPECLALSGSDTGQAAISAAISAYFVATYGYDLNLLYGETQSDGSETGSFAGSYDTTWGSITPQASAIISYESGPVIDSSPTYALIKDGTAKQLSDGITWYLFDISNWDGVSDIEFTDFYDGNQTRISHVSIYGIQCTENCSNVPDGGTTVTLLGSALFALGVMARRIRNS